MGLLMGALIVLFGYRIYDTQTIEQYSERGLALAETVTEVVDWDRLEYYVVTKDEDSEYKETLSRMRTLAASSGVEYLYVLMPYGKDGVVYVYDTDTSESHCEIGEFMDWEEAFSPYEVELSQGQHVKPFLTDDEYGLLLSVYLPVHNDEGKVAGYVGIDYPGERLIEEDWNYVSRLMAITVVIALFITVVFTLVLRYLIINPLGRITSAASSYLVIQKMDPELADATEHNSITNLDVKTNDELQNLSESLKGIHRRIQEYVKVLEAANTKAATESMTGLLNHEAFRQRIGLVIRGHRDITHAFIMCDLDNLKSINDTYGHAVGDEAILACASLLKSNFRSTDLIARMGGDEFGVFCKGPLSLDEVERRVKALNAGIKRVQVAEGAHLSLSIGVAFFNNKDINDYQTLYLSADSALYKAKEDGRDCHHIMTL